MAATDLAPSDKYGVTALSPSPASSFAGGTDDDTRIPPDTHGAVGPNHLMVVLNDGVFIQDRTTGALIGSRVSLNTFWSSTGATGVFDPKVIYDSFNNRWIFTACSNAESTTSSVLIGVSQTSDPTGAWNLYRVAGDSGGTLWADYPSIGFNNKWVVVTVNMFAISNGAFSRGRIWAFNKSNLYSNLTGSFTRFDDTSGATEVPATTFDNTLATLYLVQNWNGNSSGSGFLRISTITGAVGSEVYNGTTPAFVTTSNTWGSGAPGGVDFGPQLGSSQKVDTGDSRMQTVIYRNGSLWAAQAAFLPAAIPTRAAAQWWQISTSGTVQQFGRVDDPTGATFYAYPSLAVNKNNDVLLGYSQFSAATFATAGYSFRLSSDPVNTMETPVPLKAGEASYYKTFGGAENRWGDYSNASVDPVNDVDMWTIQEYASSPNFSSGRNRWGTWWGRVIPPNVLPVISAITPPLALQGAVVSAAITGLNLTGASAVTFSGSGVTAAIGTGGTSTNLPITVTVTSGATIGVRTVTVTTPSGTSDPFTGFTVAQLPSITSITPNGGSPGATLTAAIAGANLGIATAVTFSGSGVTATILSGGTASSMSVTVSIAASAALGLRTFTVATAAGTSQPFSSFSVLANPPTLNDVTAVSPGLSQVVAPLSGGAFMLTLNGANFDGSSKVAVGETQLITSFVDATHLTAVVPSSVLIAPRALHVTVTNSVSVTDTSTSNALNLTVVERGDINGSRSVTIGDALVTALTVGGLVKPSLPLSVGDLNLSGLANIGDALTLALFSGRVTPNLPSPAITSMSPATAIRGSSLTISGSGFAPIASDNQVVFPTSANTFVRIVAVGGGSTSLTVTVPVAAVSGPMQVVRTDFAIGSGEFPLLVDTTATPLLLASVQPFYKVDPGTSVTLSGFGFDPQPANNTVLFRSVSGTVGATVTTASSTSLTVTVPAVAVCGGVTVVVGSLASNARTVLVSGAACPVLLTDILAGGAPGGTLVLEGSGFDVSNPRNNSVLFTSSGGGTVAATVLMSGASQLHVQIPPTATDGNVTVTVGSQTSNPLAYKKQ
jgi:hypothetical protein